MGCPRCGGELTAYSLDGASAVVCGDCGYVGVPADHSPEPAADESWDEALRRFRGRPRETTTVTVGGRTRRVPRWAAERLEGFTRKQRAVVRELVREPDPADPDRTHAEIGEAAGVHRSYVGSVIREHGEVAAALAAGEAVD